MLSLRTLLPLLAVSFAASAADKYPPPFPREAARMLFENDRVEVWDVTWPKGQPTAMHEHPVDQLSVTLVGGVKRVTRLGGTPSTSQSQPGSVVFTPQGTIHMEEGMSDIPERKIMLQLKPSQPSSAPAQAPPEGAIKLMENARATVWDYTWKPGQKVSVSRTRDAVMIYLEGGAHPDQVVYVPHTTEQATQGPARAIIVELK